MNSNATGLKLHGTLASRDSRMQQSHSQSLGQTELRRHSAEAVPRNLIINGAVAGVRPLQANNFDYRLISPNIEVCTAPFMEC